MEEHYGENWSQWEIPDYKIKPFRNGLSNVIFEFLNKCYCIL